MDGNVIGLLALLATGAGAETANPVVGEWAWEPLNDVCPEVHVYTADGRSTVQSGAEVLEKRYTITPVSGGMYRVDSVVVSSNGGRDCLGTITAVGTAMTVYIQPLNSGGYFTCDSEDGMSCFGTARPRTGR